MGGLLAFREWGDGNAAEHPCTGQALNKELSSPKHKSAEVECPWVRQHQAYIFSSSSRYRNELDGNQQLGPQQAWGVLNEEEFSIGKNKI